MTTRHVSKTLLLFLSPILVLSAVAQPAPGSAVPTVSFDVVSIRQNNSGNRQMTRQSSGTSDGITMTNVPLFLIVFYAYGINDENLATGFPLWAMNERYDLTAKVAASEVPAYQSLTNRQRGQMLQKVLADRFHLQVHRESRNRPVYALVVAKSGIKIKEVSADKPSASTSKPSDSGFAHGATIFSTGPGEITGHAATMADLALSLSNREARSLGRLVVDRTGLPGKYDFTLELPVAEPGDKSDGNANQPDPGTLFTALQEQLGLKLQPATVPTEYLVIDRIERPTEN